MSSEKTPNASDPLYQGGQSGQGVQGVQVAGDPGKTGAEYRNKSPFHFVLY